MNRHGRRRALLSAVGVAGAVLAVVGVRVGGEAAPRADRAATAPGSGAGDDPVSTAPATTSSSAVPKPRTVTTLSSALGPGSAGLVGTVVGPNGPVPGATVRIERLVGDAITPATVMTDAAGAWALAGINGGRYRLRAWRPPDLAALETTVFFLTATETRTVGLTVARYGTDTLAASISPDPPVLGRPAMLTVMLSGEGIDPEGVLRTMARPDVPVQFVPGAGLVLDSVPSVTTDARGDAAFTVRCTEAGIRPAAAVVIVGVSRPLDLPVCASG